MAREGGDQRRRHQRLVDALVLHRLEHLLEVEAHERDEGAAGVEPAVEHALQAHAVEEGRERELPAALRRRERAPHLHEVRHQRAVRELDELGQAGRAAGGQQHRDVMRCGALGGRLAGATGQQVAQLEHLDVVRGCAGGLGERADADDEPRLRASQLVGELVGRVERTGAGDDAAGAQRAVQRERELGEVGEVEREHVAAPEAAAGEAGGDPLHPGRERAVGEDATARAVDERGLIGQPLGVAEDERGDVRVRDLRRRPRTLDDHHATS